MKLDDLVFIGVHSTVLALHKLTGKEVWRCKLKGGIATGDYFVTLLVEGKLLYAHSRGVLFCLDAATGRCLWENKLSGLGYGFASIAVQGISASPEKVARLTQIDEIRHSTGD